MGQQPESTNPLDPFGLWKQTQDAALESWSKSLTDAVNTSAYAETSGRMLDAYLTASAPLRKIMEQTMAQVLAQMSLPSRGEVVNLAERLTNIEMRLDDLDARLDGIARAVERTADVAAALAAAQTRVATPAGAPVGSPTRPAARMGGAASASGTTATRATPNEAGGANANRSANGTSMTARRPAPRARDKAE